MMYHYGLVKQERTPTTGHTIKLNCLMKIISGGAGGIISTLVACQPYWALTYPQDLGPFLITGRTWGLDHHNQTQKMVYKNWLVHTL